MTLPPRKPHIRIKEWKGEWLIIREPDDRELFRTSEENTAKYIKRLHERIFELEDNRENKDSAR